MKLLIEERIFSWKDRFSVRDEGGRDRYYVEGELLSWGKKLRISDLLGREVAYVEELLFSFKPRYRICADGRIIGEVVRQFSFFLPHYTVEGGDWHVEGDFSAHEYAVLQGDTTVANIRRSYAPFGDCYELDLSDPTDELSALALVLAIDCAAKSPNG